MCTSVLTPTGAVTKGVGVSGPSIQSKASPVFLNQNVKKFASNEVR